MVPLDIAEVAESSGLLPSALRFYEKRGLIEPAGRNALRRAYRPEILDRLQPIAEIGRSCWPPRTIDS